VPLWYQPLVTDQTARAESSFSNHGHAVSLIQQIEELQPEWPHDTPFYEDDVRAREGWRAYGCTSISRALSSAEGRCYTAAVNPFIECPSYTRMSIGGMLPNRQRSSTIRAILQSLRISSACCNKATRHAACKLADRILQISVSPD
jgi:hypothetical protein